MTTANDKKNKMHAGRSRLGCIALLIAVTITANVSVADDELARKASWQPVNADLVRTMCRGWMEEAGSNRDLRENVEAIVNRDELVDGPQRLTTVAKIIGIIFRESLPLVEATNQPWTGEDFPIEILETVTIPDTAISQLRLVVGRWYVRNEMYDEALEQFGQLTTDAVCDPATLLFYQGICCQRLRQKDQCLKILARLNENVDELPRRYAALSRLMVLDIQPLEEDSLDEVSRMMDDIRRRQSLYRSGTRVRDIEKNVLAKLDKMIEDLENQRQQQQNSSSAPSSPMQDSRRAGGSGSGEVKQKPQSDGGNWGNLPPRKRAAALADMTKDLPPHYREVIEEYFRQLARDSEEN